MSIKAITVIKPKNKIYFCPWSKVQYLTKRFKSLNIISIGDKYSNIFKEVPCNKRLMIQTVIIPSDMTEDDFIAVREFVESLNGESILVHCEFGQSRSPWLVGYIVDNFPNYQFEEYMLGHFNY